MKRALAIIIILLAVAVSVYFYMQSRPEIVENPAPEGKNEETPIVITSLEIREENYTGSKPVIAGEGWLADAARDYVGNLIAEFEAQANADVPALREDWGEDSPAASYTIDLGAKIAEGEKTRSVIITEYVYTGGAHGSSSYKVLTASSEDGELLSLSDVVKKDKQAAFTTLVKEKLNDWRPAGSDAPVVFPEDVADLSFTSFENWALDNENLTLYFAQYEVGPGVLGAFALPIPLKELTDFLL